MPTTVRSESLRASRTRRDSHALQAAGLPDPTETDCQPPAKRLRKKVEEMMIYEMRV